MKTSLFSMRVALALATFGSLAACGRTEKGSLPNGDPSGVVRALDGDITPPTVSIVSPSDGTVVRDIANISIATSDDAGPVVLTQLLVNGIAHQTDTQAPFAFTWDGTANVEGTYELKVLAVDAAGNLGTSAPVTVTLRHVLILNPPASTAILSGLSVFSSIALSGPAPASGVISLTADPPGAVTMVAAVSLTEGRNMQASFSIKASPQTVPTVATISATYQGTTKSFSVTLMPPSDPALTSFAVGTNVAGGSSTTGVVNVQRSVAAAIPITLVSDNPAVVVPASVTIPATSTTTSFAVTTTAVATATTATVTASLPSGVTWTAKVTVLPGPFPHVVSLTAGPNPIAVGQTGTGTVTLDIPAPAGGAVVTLAASNFDSISVPSLWMGSSMTVPEGALTGTFPIVPSPYGGSFTSSVTASLNGSSAFVFPYKVTRTEFTGNAAYDFTLKAPKCGAATASCDTGSLIDSRSTLNLEVERNQPNTLFNSCADGYQGIGGGSSLFSRGVYHFDQSLDRMKVATTDGSALAPGKAVNIEVTMWYSGRLDLWSAPDATNPVWTLITSQQVSGPLGGLRPTAATIPFTLPTGTLQAIRGVFGIPPTGTVPIPCPNDIAFEYGDRDDLVFATVDQALPNAAPTADAGPDQTITLPPVAILLGKASDDGLPTPPAALTTTWSKVSGPGTVIFSDPAAATAAATFSIAGTYVLQFEASDGALTATDTVTVNVNSGGPANTAPLVDAGSDQIITLPAGTTVTGTATDDGKPNPPGALTVSWAQIAGPGVATFASATSLSTGVSFSLPGTYTLRLTADDGQLAATDDVTVVGNPAPVNQAPVVNAGPDRAVTMPAAAALAGTVSDDTLPVPHVVTVTWTKVSGPGTVTFANAGTASTTATFSAAGSYVLRLAAGDGALTSNDTVAVTVSPAITLKVQYRAVSPAVGDNQIRAGLNIVNVGPTAVPLRELKVRYWYTVDTNRSQTVECESAAIGCSRITAAFTTVSPTRPGADRYLEVGFVSSAGNLAAGAQTGEIRGRIRKTDLSNYNEANDHSYAASLGAAPPTSLIDWSRVTLYRNGVRIWGTEP